MKMLTHENDRRTNKQHTHQIPKHNNNNKKTAQPKRMKTENNNSEGKKIAAELEQFRWSNYSTRTVA